MSELDDVLAHHGVKGMHWGQRRAQKKIEKGDRKFEKNAGTAQTFFKIYNAGAHDFNTNKIDAINNKPVYKKAADAGIFLNDNHPMTVKYHKEIQAAFVDSLNKAANSMGTNASGTKRIGVEGDPNGEDWHLVLQDVKHAGDAIKLKLTKSAKGEITKITLVEPLVHDDLDELDQVLLHYGVKGMHWGKRKDDSGPSLPVHSDAAKASEAKAKAAKGGKSALSNAELKLLVERMNLEKQFNQLNPTPSAKAQKFISDLILQAGRQHAGQLVSKEMGKILGRILGGR